MYTKEAALELLKKYNDSESLIHHGLTVSAVMERFAAELGEDEGYWAVVGLLHDLDYGKWPEEHCKVSGRLLEEAGYDGAFIHAVLSHGWGLCCDVEPELKMEKVLYTIDELTGLITAACYMRPSRSVLDIEVKSVKKKFKDSHFAAGVNRQVILDGCAMLGMELDQVIQLCIEGMRAHADEIGLRGEL